MKELEEQESILFSAGSLFFLLFWFLWHVNQTFPNQAAKQILILYDIFLFLHGEKQMTKLNTWFVRKRWVFLGDIWMPLFECLLSVKLKIFLAFWSKLFLSVSVSPSLSLNERNSRYSKALRGFWVYRFDECSMWCRVCYTSLLIGFSLSPSWGISALGLDDTFLCSTYLWFLFFFLLSTVLILILLTQMYLYSLYVQVLYASVQSHIMLQRLGQ